MDPQDWLNTICFVVTTLVVVAGMWIVKKMKLPCWKLQIICIALHEVIAILLLASRLTNG